MRYALYVSLYPLLGACFSIASHLNGSLRLPDMSVDKLNKLFRNCPNRFCTDDVYVPDICSLCIFTIYLLQTASLGSSIYWLNISCSTFMMKALVSGLIRIISAEMWTITVFTNMFEVKGTQNTTIE